MYRLDRKAFKAHTAEKATKAARPFIRICLGKKGSKLQII